jgi:nucleoside-diphosphate-sugar epimerase
MERSEYLLTGASGFLGKIIHSTLASTGSVKTLGRSAGNEYVVDLINPFTLRHSFDTVVHVSGKAHVIPSTPEEAAEFFSVNYAGTVNLAHALAQSGALPEHFVFISTVAVYGKDSGELLDEETPTQGETPYAKSKIQAEEFLREWSVQNHVKLTILRLPLIVAANAPGNLGSMVRVMKRGLYAGIGSGEARKSMVLATDVARFIPVIKTTGGIYNLTDGYNPSMLELENAIALKLGRRKPLRLPDFLLKVAAFTGDFLGKWAPLNTARYRKLTSTLTFSDARARNAGWDPKPVITNLPL